MADSLAPRTRYRSIIADSGRWDGFAFRPGDVVISTPSKCGTTWTQMLVRALDLRRARVPGAAGRGVAVARHVQPPARRGDAALPPSRIAALSRRTRPSTDSAARRRHVPRGRPRSRDVAISYEHHAANLDFPRFWNCAPRPLATRTSPSCRRAHPVGGSGRAVPDLRRRRDANLAAAALIGAASPRHGLAASGRSERRPLPLRRLDG